jgi:type VI secretion system secreted protein VgrG
MENIQIHLNDSDASFSVRRFRFRERISSLSEVWISAVSPLANPDLDALLGKEAVFSMDGGLPGGKRRLYGICSKVRHVKAEVAGLSTYHLHVVPRLWLQTQRRNYRIFKHLSLPDIARTLLREWHIDTIDSIRDEYPQLEFRVQYGESDYAFLCRTLEEAGITFYFVEDAASCRTRLVLTDHPAQALPRPLGPIRYISDVNDAPHEACLTHARLTHSVRPGRLVLRDPDFRVRPEVPIMGEASATGASHRLEAYVFEPGSIVDDKGLRHATMRVSHDTAGRRLGVERRDALRLDFRTNAFDLHPGTVFHVQDHPYSAIEPKDGFLMCDLSIEGTHDGTWTAVGRAVPASERYQPPRRTRKPRIAGVQSATVVGPPGEDIHTDALGRVRVQFWWDREGKFDDQSSCWIRVSQAWAGAGFGVTAIPRVGHEVLVGFVEGDPDHPVIVGRVHGSTTPTPHDLPARKSVTVWRGCSTPDRRGANEIHFDDASGRELLHVHAERDLRKIVKSNEVESTGGCLTSAIGASRATTIGTLDTTVVGQKYSLSVEPRGAAKCPTGIEVSDGRIVLTTGEASLVLDGADISLETSGAIRLHSSEDDVLIQGGPHVRINCGLASSKRDLELALVDPFGNSIQRSWLSAEVEVEGREREAHEGFTAGVARRAVGKRAVVRLHSAEPDEDEHEEQET